MKKLLAVLVVVALAVSMSATAFGYTLYGFEKKANADMWQEHWYTDCTLRHVTAEISTEQKKSGDYSMKVVAPAGEEEFEEFGIWCEATPYLTFITADMVFDCDIYVPEDGNVTKICFYICDDNWDYFSFGSLTIDEYDTWISLSEVLDFGYFQDYVDNDGVLPCHFITECYAEDNTMDSYFYFDNFYFGTQEERDAAMSAGEKVDIQYQDPNATATPEPTAAPETPAGDKEADTNNNAVWFIVGGVVAVAVVAAVVIVVAKKKK